jgi:hypothetical protein
MEPAAFRSLGVMRGERILHDSKVFLRYWDF